MKIEHFKSGTWKKQYQYRSFVPTLINHDWTWEDPRINVLLEQATRSVGELNAFSLIVPNVDLFIQMHIVKEAQTSSRIEGTRTEIDEAVMPEEMISPEKRDDWREVRNYIDAINKAIAELDRLPVSNRLLCDTHAILMRGARGETKNPGEIRRAQNWIGGTGPMDAAFVPPHQDEVADLMSDLEKFLHNDQVIVPDLIRAAIAHYQFETIHPYNDGNGRIGRLLITLYLVSKGVLKKPSLYLSDYFERNRSSYIDGLMRVRMSSDLNHWIRFFLGGVWETAQKGCNTFQALLKFREEAEAKAMAMGRRTQNALAAINFMYQQPIFAAKDLTSGIGVTQPTADALVQAFVSAGLLVEATGQMRNRIFVFDPYLKLFAK
ncbi:Fic family protein [Prosthecomicrobium hirschii]|uniref:Fic family protein n=1 Tax=Prosthecodimorpha hirschii TaxID=665126 RepID=UPI001129D066|nr:Fic/DOC family N-terminal domain-containing protein [Prosthecomicrobium hirschii]MCW1841572.1 Fic family protein [Prosthecomicrobium hirschii]TPQ49383.1 cell filamentation protein Fic [Prosthecomicrobium hirschii]